MFSHQSHAFAKLAGKAQVELWICRLNSPWVWPHNPLLKNLNAAAHQIWQNCNQYFLSRFWSWTESTGSQTVFDIQHILCTKRYHNIKRSKTLCGKIIIALLNDCKFPILLSHQTQIRFKRDPPKHVKLVDNCLTMKPNWVRFIEVKHCGACSPKEMLAKQRLVLHVSL